MHQPDRPYLAKSLESLVGAESELANGRYNNCANRCYYACFQAAIDALREDIRPHDNIWNHRFVPSQFEGQLIGRRKRYGTVLRGVLQYTYSLRQKADYSQDAITSSEARRMFRQATSFVHAVRDNRDSRT